eukprot:TRINITY_DN5422_c0_g1_i1.p1 TRINITY_DN5422_c0_g1~~TRINITY_DN5422_c0_g1_i1.p1  ORF type:complete len:452 (+),score=94.85 TRINITY_DN5422_c0_g1_i1:259-1614(+)
MGNRSLDAGQVNNQISNTGNNEAAAPNEMLADLAGASKQQLYDIMSQMKVLIEQNHEQARQILIDNPGMTKSLFQAQIMLGMVPTPKVMSSTQQAPTHPPLLHSEATQHKQLQSKSQGQSNMISVPNESQNRQPMPMYVEPQGQRPEITKSQMQSSITHPSLQWSQYTSSQSPHTTPQLSQAQSMHSSMHLPHQPVSQSVQQSSHVWGYSGHHILSQDRPVEHQVSNMLPTHSQPPPMVQPNTGFHQSVQSPIHQKSRPVLHNPPPQMQNQPMQTMGFHQGFAPQQQQPQPTFPPRNQPPVPKQLPPQQIYKRTSGNPGGPILRHGIDGREQGMGQSSLPTVGHGMQSGWGPNMCHALSNTGHPPPWALERPERAPHPGIGHQLGCSQIPYELHTQGTLALPQQQQHQHPVQEKMMKERLMNRMPQQRTPMPTDVRHAIEMKHRNRGPRTN